jgi:hypothetical protein
MAAQRYRPAYTGAVLTYDEMRPGQIAVKEYLDNRQVDGPLNDSESYYTGTQRRWLATWVRLAANALHLEHWTLRVYHEAPDTEAHASVTITDGRVFASFRFDNTIFAADPADARVYLAHELIHLLFDPLLQTVESDLRGALSDQALMIFRRAFTRQLELGVDHLSTVVASALPMPPWSEAEDIHKRSNTTAQEQYREAKQPTVTGLVAPPMTWTTSSSAVSVANNSTAAGDAQDPPAEQ